MKHRFLLFFLVVGCGGTQIGPDGSAPEGGLVDTGHPPIPCGSMPVDGLKIASIQNANPLDPLGYPPYAADACQLAYIAKDGTLVLRDLKLGSEVVVADAMEKPRRPSLAGGTLAWEATPNGQDIVRWRNTTGVVHTIPLQPYAKMGEPRAATDAIVLTAWNTADPQADTDVLLFSTVDEKLIALGSGPAQQRFGDVDATRVAWADFSEGGPQGAFDADLMTDSGYAPADIVVYDRASKIATTRKASGKQAFPLLVGGGNIAYLDWNSVRPQPKFFAYGFKVGSVLGDPTLDANIGRTDTIETNAPYVRPTVHGDSFDWLENGWLWRRPTDLSTTAQRIDSFNGNAWGVVGSDAVSILAVGSLGNLTLLGVDR